ncbi:unnamed protein product [Vitrella brassicaformis CCMP3155]|uniref:EGF-like domain-containing protein n=1 Tax=Vitrella brassicaformis (strain CCMP3155) TaxID=1169540 RepID=A0A0G4EI61_VITBC|nr:unnamed protein product [Vitrella brassicaformis CCMP3155]|eukprot:CEL96680.1 unnamed protein product [Vitrella brassicaformis CCMP3155]
MGPRGSLLLGAVVVSCLLLGATAQTPTCAEGGTLRNFEEVETLSDLLDQTEIEVGGLAFNISGFVDVCSEGISKNLSDPEVVNTIFAFTDAALDQIVVNAPTSGSVEQFCLYHFVEGKICPELFKPGTSLIPSEDCRTLPDILGGGDKCAEIAVTRIEQRRRLQEGEKEHHYGWRRVDIPILPEEESGSVAQQEGGTALSLTNGGPGRKNEQIVIVKDGYGPGGMEGTGLSVEPTVIGRPARVIAIGEAANGVVYIIDAVLESPALPRNLLFQRPPEGETLYFQKSSGPPCPPTKDYDCPINAFCIAGVCECDVDFDAAFANSKQACLRSDTCRNCNRNSVCMRNSLLQQYFCTCLPGYFGQGIDSDGDTNSCGKPNPIDTNSSKTEITYADKTPKFDGDTFPPNKLLSEVDRFFGSRRGQ